MAGGNKVTKLELRLVDGLTSPAKAAVRSIGRLNKALGSVKGGSVGGVGGRNALGMATGGREATRNAVREGGMLAGAGRGLRRAAGDTAALSGAAGVGIAAAFRQNYDLEKALNVSQAAGGLDLKQRNALMAEAVRLNPQFAATNAEIVTGFNELLKTGFSFDQSMGSIESILNASQAMETSIADASAGITDAMVSLRMPMKTTDESFRSSLKLADLFAEAVAQTNATFEDFRVSSKYFNPVAAAFKMSAEEAIAWQTVLAKGGIKGSSAGTGLRAAPIAIAAPSKAGLEAFARLGLDPSQFSGKRSGQASGASIAGALEASGLTTEGLEAGIDKLIASGRFKKSPKKLASAIIDQFGEELGAATAEDRTLIADSVNRAMLAGTTQIDLYGVLKALRDKGASPADFKDIFGGNHASKMMGVQIELYDQILDSMKHSAGRAKTMREAMMSGIVGDVADFTAAVESMSIAFGKSGLLSTASKGIDVLASAISSLADANPALLRLAGYATLAVAAIAPLGFALSGVAAVAGLVVSPVGLVAGALGGLVAINLTPITNGLRTFSNALRRTIDPAIIARFGDVKSAVADFFSSFKVDDLAFNRAADELGMAIGRLVNNAPKIGPTLAEWGAGLKQFGADALAANIPTLTQGFDSIKRSLADFASVKIDAFMNLGSSLVGFFEKAGPLFTPATASAVALVADSFRTLSAGFEAVGKFVGAATDGLVTFATAFLDNIDPKAMQSVASGLKAVLDTVAAPVRALGDAFDWISRAIGGANGTIESFASGAGAAVAKGFSGIVNAMTSFKLTPEALAGWENIKSTFATIGSYVPDFSGIIGAVSSFVSTIAGLVERLAGAIERMRSVVANIPNAGPAIAAMAGGPGLATAPAQQSPLREALSKGVPTPLPRKAAGGLVRGERSYLVGERGPEIATFGRNGSVTPNHKLGGGGDTHNYFNIHAHDTHGVVREIMQEMGSKVRRSNQISIDGGRRG